jgi:hypothetical protein
MGNRREMREWQREDRERACTTICTNGFMSNERAIRDIPFNRHRGAASLRRR